MGSDLALFDTTEGVPIRAASAVERTAFSPRFGVNSASARRAKSIAEKNQNFSNRFASYWSLWETWGAGWAD